MSSKLQFAISFDYYLFNNAHFKLTIVLINKKDAQVYISIRLKDEF